MTFRPAEASLEYLRTLLAKVNIRDLVPTLVARHVLFSHEMGSIYSQASQEEQISKLITILRSKPHYMGPLIDALIRNGLTATAEALVSYNKEQRGKSSSDVLSMQVGQELTTSSAAEGNGVVKNGNCPANDGSEVAGNAESKKKKKKK